MHEIVQHFPTPLPWLKAKATVKDPYAKYLHSKNQPDEDIYVSYEDDTLLGKTIQGEVNKFIKDGLVLWTCPIKQLIPSKERPGKTIVILELPRRDLLDDIRGWTLTWGPFLSIADHEVETLGVRTGRRLTFSAVIKRSPEGGPLGIGKGVFAFYRLPGAEAAWFGKKDNKLFVIPDQIKVENVFDDPR